ncbi:hypothetical protein [Enterococcus larvae]|uniref:hypothetical protein n=1 Tax=Enterococcus larvae TaxID=2794352 RepID=UPI003F3A5177
MEKDNNYVLISNKYNTNKLLYYSFDSKKFYVSEPENFNPIFLIPLGSIILTRYLKLFENIQIADSLFSYLSILAIGVGLVLGLIASHVYRKFNNRKYSETIISTEEARFYLKDTKRMMQLFVPFLVFLLLLILTYQFFFKESFMNLLTNMLLVIASVIFIIEFNFTKKRKAYIELKNFFKEDS